MLRMQADAGLALVTGASSGIGVQFARVLAERGFALAITARRVDRLGLLKRQFEDRYGVEVRVIGQDLGTPDGAARLFDQVQQSGRPVSLLINNAGLGHFGRMVEQDPADLLSAIQVNVASLTVLTRLVASEMKGQGRGYILNVASVAGLYPIPRYTVYSATKAYVVAFSQTLRYELRKCGVQVSVLCPGYTATEFFARAGHRPSRLMRLMWLDPYRVAQAGVAGVLKGKAIVIPGAVYRLSALVSRLVPRPVASALAAGAVKTRPENGKTESIGSEHASDSRKKGVGYRRGIRHRTGDRGAAGDRRR